MPHLNLSISIVTPAKNASATISDCIESVRHQDYPAEHVIVEGSAERHGETTFESAIYQETRFIHAPGTGIYDALNRGLKEAKGEIIGTLNADDFYAHRNVLSRVAKVFSNPSIDSCYGDLIYVDARNPAKAVRYWRGGTYREKLLYRGWMPPHPTFFVRRSVYEAHGGFNPRFGSSADYELIVRFFMCHQISTAYIPEVLVIMRTGGLSNASFRNRIRANRMDKMAWKSNGLRARPWTFIAKPLCKMGQYIHRKPLF